MDELEEMVGGRKDQVSIGHYERCTIRGQKLISRVQRPLGGLSEDGGLGSGQFMSCKTSCVPCYQFGQLRPMDIALGAFQQGEPGLWLKRCRKPLQLWLQRMPDLDPNRRRCLTVDP